MESEQEQPKSPAQKVRARASADRIIRKAAKRLDRLTAELTDQDVSLALERLRSQLNATKKMWDVNAKVMVDIPD